MFYLTHRYSPIRCYHAGSEWTLEQWQWRGASHSPKPQHYRNFTIRLFSVISRTFVRERVLPLCRGAVNVFYSPSRLGKKNKEWINEWLIFFKNVVCYKSMKTEAVFTKWEMNNEWNIYFHKRNITKQWWQLPSCPQIGY